MKYNSIVVALLLASWYFHSAIAGGVWANIASLPEPRSDETADPINGLIYLTGGCDGPQNCNAVAGVCSCSSYTSSVLLYNPKTDSYSDLPEMPIPRYRHVSCVWHDSIFIFGGRTLVNDSIIYRVDKFNTTSSEWSTLHDAPPNIGSDNACFVLGDIIYIMGGYNADYSVSMNITHKYFPQNDTWSNDLAQMPHGRGDFSAVAVNGKGYVYGGYQASNFCSPINYADEYDPVLDKWETIASLGDHTAEKRTGVVLDGRIFSIGGEKKKRLVNCNDLDLLPQTEVFSYGLDTNTWRNETPLPDPRFRFASAVVGTQLFVFGGQGPLTYNNESFPVLYTAHVYYYSVPPTAATTSAPTVSPTDIINIPASENNVAGAVAGGVIGGLAGLTVLAAMIYFFSRRRPTNPSQQLKDNPTTNELADENL